MVLNRTSLIFEQDLTSEELIALTKEREATSLRYNEALTELDKALKRLRFLPYDEQKITYLNENWDLLASKTSTPGSLLGRLRGFVWTMLAPLFGGNLPFVIRRQQKFNSMMVDHINKSRESHQEATDALIQFSKQVTPLVDIKEKEVSGYLLKEFQSRYKDLQKDYKDLQKDDKALQADYEDLKSSVAVAIKIVQEWNRRTESLKELNTTSPKKQTSVPIVSTFDHHKYVEFEDRFRGSTEEIQKRMETYLPYFSNVEADVLDVGCGRGEFLDLLNDHGISARGIDINQAMVELCRDRGLTAEQNDALTYLTAEPDESLGGLFAAQVVEHLEPTYLLKFLDTAYLKLRPGSKLILETINVASWSAFFHSYLRDTTHVSPLHPETLNYLVSASGFQKVEIVYKSPYPDSFKLEPFLELSTLSNQLEYKGDMENLMYVFNKNVEKLNRLLFSEQDYAIIAQRG